MDFQIITFDPNTGLATLGIPMVMKKISGMDKLMQTIVLAVLKNGGRDVFEPDVGSGLRGDIGQFNFSEADEVKTLVVQRLRAVEQQVLNFQAGQPVSPSEKLRKLDILGIAFDEATFQTVVKIRIYNESGQTQEVLV